MADRVRLTINGTPVEATAGTSVAAAIANAGIGHTRRSVGGEARGPLCGMGICFECRSTVDGVPHQRTCNRIVADGMEVVTDG